MDDKILKFILVFEQIFMDFPIEFPHFRGSPSCDLYFVLFCNIFVSGSKSRQWDIYLYIDSHLWSPCTYPGYIWTLSQYPHTPAVTWIFHPILFSGLLWLLATSHYTLLNYMLRYRMKLDKYTMSWGILQCMYHVMNDP